MGKEDAILGSTQLNKVIGMIIPPPETKNLINKVAQLVAKYGLSVEEKMKNDPNPKFSFLKEGDPYSNYYEQRVIQIRALIEKAKEEEDKAKEQEANDSLSANNNLLSKKREADKDTADNIEKEKQLIDNEKKNKIKEELRAFIKQKEAEMAMTNSLNDIKPPKPDKFSISHPNIPGLDMDIIKITAQFVARNGQRFLSELSERESSNSQFHFLKPQHNLFGYFTYLVSSYSEILHNRKEEIGKLALFSSNRNDILKQAMNRVLYEKKLKNLQKMKGNYDEGDTKKKQIDWYDFVVVDTIEFYEEEQLDQNVYEEPIEAHDEAQDEEKEDDIQITDGTKPIQANEEAMQQREEQENSPLNEISTEEQTVTSQGIPIRKNYVRPSIHAEEEEMIKCPLCKQSVNKSILDEHIKLELLDPKWKENQKELSKRTGSSLLPQTTNYLSDFVKSRPDLFGNINEIQSVEQKRKQEVKQQNSSSIWDGYNPNMTRTTANIKMFKQQNKKHIEESKKRNEAQK